MSKGRKKHVHPRCSGYDADKSKARYFEHVKEVLKAAGGDGLFEEIPAHELTYLYRIRFLPIKVVKGKGEDIPESVLKDARATIPIGLDTFHVCPFRDGTKMKLRPFFFAGIPLIQYLECLDEGRYGAAADLKVLLGRFLPTEDALQDMHRSLASVMFVIGLSTGAPDSQIYWAEFQGLNMDRVRGTGAENSFVMHRTDAERCPVRLNDGTMRRPYRLVEPFPYALGLDGVKTDARALGIAGAAEGTKLDVFVERHALQRLRERLAPFEPWDIWLHLLRVFDSPKAHRTNRGSVLVELAMQATKVGYLVGEIVPAGIVIMTFLFITNDGTPEGRKLQKLWGLEKPDKKFLEIDKLSTFVALDMKSDSRLAALFAEAGCGGLLDLREKLKGIAEAKDTTLSIDFILRYLERGSILARRVPKRQAAPVQAFVSGEQLDQVTQSG